jgi:P-type Ca2+ transporter type 2C
LSLFTQLLVVYVPFLQAAFHTTALSAFDWLVATAVGSTLLVVMELLKWGLRMRRPEMSAANRSVTVGTEIGANR